VIPAGRARLRRGSRLAVLLLALALPGSAPAAPQGGASNAPAPSLDFTDESYRERGLDPARVRDRLSEESGLAVVDRSPDLSRRGLRALEWRGGYDAAGCPVFFHRFGVAGQDAFLPGPAGEGARRLAEEFVAYTFPGRQAPGGRLLVQDRQDPVFDTSPGGLSRNALGLWTVVRVTFDATIFRSREGLAALKEIQARNGSDRDGTPILKHPSEIRVLERAGFVRLEPAAPTEGPWVLWRLEAPVPRPRIPADAFPAVVRVDEGYALDPKFERAFLCLARSGIAGASLMPEPAPFVQELPIPPVLEPAGRPDPTPDGSRLPGLAEAPPVSFFEIRARPVLHRFHPDLPPSIAWGYDGKIPGPTIRVRRGDPYLLRVWNDLPAGGTGGIGLPRMACRSDLFPRPPGSDGDPAPPGAFRDHYSPALRGAPESRPGTVTGGYRDACPGFGAANTYRGLAGFMIASDAADSGDENDPDPRALRLPSGACDVPLLLADKRFDESLDHAPAWDPFEMGTCSGEHVAVNGVLQPYFRVARRKYRFRLWNAGPSRTYALALGGGPPFTVIAADGYLLESPAAPPSLPLGPDQRWDIVVDFSAVKQGGAVYLEDRSAPPRFRGAAGLPNAPSRILKFVVERDVPDPSRVPQRLRPPAGDAAPTGIPVRTFAISDARGAWTLNGKGFDPGRADAVVRPGSRELWIVKNESPDVAHPIRLGAEGILLPQAGGPPWASGPRTRVNLAPGQEARILMTVPDWPGRYLLSGADAAREDRGLMFRWDVRP